jgi:hypothetical protein
MRDSDNAVEFGDSMGDAEDQKAAPFIYSLVKDSPYPDYQQAYVTVPVGGPKDFTLRLDDDFNFKLLAMKFQALTALSGIGPDADLTQAPGGIPPPPPPQGVTFYTATTSGIFDIIDWTFGGNNNNPLYNNYPIVAGMSYVIDNTGPGTISLAGLDSYINDGSTFSGMLDERMNKNGVWALSYIGAKVTLTGLAGRVLFGDDNAGFGGGPNPLNLAQMQGADYGFVAVRVPSLLPRSSIITFSFTNTYTQPLYVAAAIYGMKVRL